MVRLTTSVHVTGDVESADDLTIDGLVDGQIWAEGHKVIVGPTAVIRGDIVARDITVFGDVTGTLVASQVADIRPSGRVQGRVVAERFTLEDGGFFTGAAEPHRLPATLEGVRARHAPAEDAAVLAARSALPRASEDEPVAGGLVKASM
jgi:cytoskeletal protein CcmA (bactofilin family)